MCATDDGESNSATLFSLGNGLCCARRGLASSSSAAELFCVGQDQVHVLEIISLTQAAFLCDTDLVECEHLPNHLSTILKCYLHAIVDLQL
jgi:hypothetical protein